MTLDLSKFTNEEKQRANQELEKLCHQYGVKPFKLESKKGRWKQLGLNMIGLSVDSKQVGRPARKEDKVWEIANYVRCIIDFAEMEGKKILVKEAIYKAVEVFDIKEKQYDGGEYNTPFEVVRGILYNKFPDIEKRMLEEQKEQDWE